MTALPQPAEPSRASWLEWRRGGLGSSDIAAVLGLSPWASPWSVWADKVALTPIDESDAEHLEFGRRAEPMLAQWFHDRTGLYVAGEQTWCSNPAEPWQRCTVDGFVFDHDDGEVGIEAALSTIEFKTTTDSVKSWETDGVPPYYATQAVWLAVVTRLPVVHFGVLHMSFGHPQFRTYEFHPDADDKALVEKAARDFWDHVVTGTPPPVDAHPSTTAALAQAWDATDGVTVEADELDLFNVEEARRLKAQVKSLGEQLTLRENAIRARLGEATVLTHGVDGKGRPTVLATWKPSERTGFDHKALMARYPRAAARFITKTPTRTLLVKSTKGE